MSIHKGLVCRGRPNNKTVCNEKNLPSTDCTPWKWGRSIVYHSGCCGQEGIAAGILAAGLIHTCLQHTQQDKWPGSAGGRSENRKALCSSRHIAMLPCAECQVQDNHGRERGRLTSGCFRKWKSGPKFKSLRHIHLFVHFKKTPHAPPTSDTRPRPP